MASLLPVRVWVPVRQDPAPLSTTVRRRGCAYPRTCTGLYRDTYFNVGKQVSIYVRDEDLALWKRAEAYARRNRMPVSGLVMTALEDFLDWQESKGARSTDED